MEEKKVKQILVYTDFTEYSNNAIKHSIELTRIFDAHLNILHVIDENTMRFFKTKEPVKLVEGKLDEIRNEITSNYKINVISHIQEGCSCTIINSLAETTGALIIVCGMHPSNEMQYLTAKNTLKIVRKSRIPYFLVPTDLSKDSCCKNVILPLSHLKECKETIPWAAYFGKLNKAEIHLQIPKNPDTYTKNNLFFARKLFKQYEVNFKEYETGISVFSINKHSIQFASTKDSFVIIMNTKRYGLLDYIFGPPEKRLISSKYNIPVLSLNPRDDLFIPCV